eukprot:CAMPEP_0204160850 /NCGR_PEP_ID=MMETSP0361-20130328/34209_1 /ASSEMBLY_ACC=CAM_ASM_000343 /TAXON_ID=268821 /ORGANISM="Scrippsiella Hangoei, Strain SHTV-5" /LENGTH=411 /DNA_ID=CAMNT_0051117183 /DNA_START=94 /DNA_END=1325 /DNA_ORIENTATION=+
MALSSLPASRKPPQPPRPTPTMSQGRLSTSGQGRRPSSTPAGPKRRPSGTRRGTRQMDTNPVGYWDAQARDYDDNIFSTIDEDSTRIITRTLDACANTEEGPFGCCVDLGCGAGKYLPALAARFRRVSAYDLSPKLVGLASKEVKAHGFSNVEVHVRDLAQVWYRDVQDKRSTEEFGSQSEMESYGFAVMANVLIAPVNDSARGLMMRNALRSLCPGGRLLVVVPSLESALYVNMRCRESGCSGPHEVIVQPTRAEGADIVQGIFSRSGVRTKHYLDAEFRLLAGRVGFEVDTCEKVLYTWRSELGLATEMMVPHPLREERGPLPWDWMFLLRKPGGPDADSRSGLGALSAPPLPSASVREGGLAEYPAAAGGALNLPALPPRSARSTPSGDAALLSRGPSPASAIDAVDG